uniref:Uncharacterized protein n=1 Tax=Chrysemys picta bellii TaxID=8478 RepID=A0A8C3F278_CHRPI
MGLPIQLVAVVNNNDIIHRAIQHGDFSFSGSVTPTLASAMDIQEPYNMERILWLLLDCDGSLIKTLMEQFYMSKNLTLPEELHRKLSEVLSSCSASDEDIVQAMRRCWEDNRYLLCPHSAVAVHYHYKQLDCHLSKPRCCLAPASAAKFPDAVLRAKLVPEVPPEIQALNPYLSPWKDHGASPQGIHFEASGGEEGEQEQSTWIHQRQVMLDQPDCLL